MRKPPDQDSRLGLVKPPALGLFGLVMPSAQTGEVALAGPSSLFVRDRVILVAAGRRIAAPGESTGALADVDQVSQRSGWPVAVGFPLMEAFANRERPNGNGQCPAIPWPGAGCHDLPSRQATSA